MSDTLIGLPVLSGCFFVALVLGITAHKTHFCTMGGVSDWVNLGAKGRLGAWLLATATAIAAVLLLEFTELASLAETRPPYRSANFAWLRYLLGGLMFGIGMTLASGCATKTLVRLGAGNLKSLIVFIVIGIFAYLMTKTDFYGVVFHSWMEPVSIDLTQFGFAGQDIGSLLAPLLGAVDPFIVRAAAGAFIIIAILLFVLRTGGLRHNGRNWLGGFVVGLCVGAGWYLTGGPWGQAWIEAAAWADAPPVGVGVQSFTFVNPLGETLSLLADPGNRLLMTFGVAAVIGVIAGAFASALSSGQFRVEWFTSWDDFFRHIGGAALMGIGGVLALGCTVGQGISGMSTLALGSFLALSAIVLGCAITLKVEYYKILYEDASLMHALVASLADLRLLPNSMRRLEAI